MAPFPNFLSALTDRDRDLKRVGLMLLLGPLAAVVTAFVAVVLTTLGSEGAPGEGDGPVLARSSVFVIVLGISLGAMAVGFVSTASLVFRRGFKTFVTAARRFRWGLLVWGLLVTLWGLAVISAGDVLLRGETLDVPPVLDPTASWSLRIQYVAAITLGFLVAATAEEVVFRGYLLQQMAAFTDRMAIPVLASSVAFALIHLEFAPEAMAARTLTGVAFCWAALRLGGLEFAIGAHLANNLLLGLASEAMLPDAEAFDGDALAVVLEAALALWIIGAAEATRRLRWFRPPAS